MSEENEQVEAVVEKLKREDEKIVALLELDDKRDTKLKSMIAKYDALIERSRKSLEFIAAIEAK